MRDPGEEPDQEGQADGRDRSMATGKRLLKRGRGESIVRLRAAVTRPLTRHLPLGLLRRLHRLRRRALTWRYTDADPFALRYIDPVGIERSILEYAPRHPQYGRVVGGTWDLRYDEFEHLPVYQAIEAHFVEGVPWDDTGLFDCFLDQLERFGNAWGYTTPDGFAARCAELDRLFESLRTRGYRRQGELSGGDWSRSPIPRFDEINVDIGHDGTVLWRAYGQHRLAMAKVLGIEKVPVIVQRRHRSWQHVRDTLDEHGPSAVHETLVGENPHPDLRDLLVERET